MKYSTAGRMVGMGMLAGLASLTTPAIADDMSPDALVQALKGGGHVIYMRHARTETDYADQISAKMGNCATQRVLSAEGWADARGIGAAVAALGIPVGDVLSSEYCRAWQTADLAFGHHVATDALNFEPAENYDPAQISAMSARITPLLSAKPKDGNLAIVGHDDPFEAATGIYPEPQGVAYVIRPDGAGGFAVLGHIDPADWSKL